MQNKGRYKEGRKKEKIFNRSTGFIATEGVGSSCYNYKVRFSTVQLKGGRPNNQGGRLYSLFSRAHPSGSAVVNSIDLFSHIGLLFSHIGRGKSGRSPKRHIASTGLAPGWVGIVKRSSSYQGWPVRASILSPLLSTLLYLFFPSSLLLGKGFMVLAPNNLE